MPLALTVQNDLAIALFEGLFDVPMWGSFLRRLLARTGAQRVHVTLRNASAPSQPPLLLRAVVDAWRPFDDSGETEPFDATVYAALRPNRVYALDEMRDFDNKLARTAQDEALVRASVGDARLIRVNGRANLQVWIVLLHEREAFDARDSALLTGLVPAMSVAMAMLWNIGELRCRTHMAEEALALLGIGQAALDDEGRTLVADGLGRAELGLPLASGASLSAQPINPAWTIAELGEAPPRSRRAVRQGAQLQKVLLRPVPPVARAPANPAVAIAAFRRPTVPDPASAAQVIAATLGLSAREASLAEAMSRGLSIVEAGRALRLTPETARNYSKRIYAKTGASGQSDLVRMVLTGLAPLA